MSDKEPELNIENTLWDSEENFHHMFQKHNAVVLLIEPVSGQIMDANMAAESFYGYSVERLRQMNITDINTLPPEQVMQERQRALQAKRNYFIFPHRLAGGQTRTVEVHSSPATLKGRQFLFSIIHDITERKQAEDLLLKSKENYDKLVASIPVGVYVLHTGQGVFAFEYVSPRMAEILDVKVEDLLAHPDILVKKIHPDDMKSFAQNSTVTNGEFQPIKWKGRVFVDGNVKWLHIISSPELQENNDVNWHGLVTDITERKQAEDALLASEQSLNTLFETMSEGVALNEVVYDENGEMIDYRVLNVNRAFYATADYRGKNVVGAFATQLYGMSSEFIKEFWKGHKEKKSTAYTEMVSPLENRWFFVTTSPFINDRFVTSFFDITERKQAEEKIRQLNADLEKRVDERTHELREAQEQLVRHEKLAVLGQMASTIGHELRNPLGVISGAVYYLNLVQPNADDKIKQYLGIIDQEVRTSEKIISDLLDFARIKSIDREVVSVSELIDQTLLRFPVPASVHVSIEIAENLPRAYVDPRQMIQILGNLVTNAWQAMSSAETENSGQLSLYSTLQNDMINITVKDNGAGITTENMKKIFEPLFTTKAKGIGLGLAVSRKLAEANDGRIEVESEAGRGSSFHLLLPIFKEIQ